MRIIDRTAASLDQSSLAHFLAAGDSTTNHGGPQDIAAGDLVEIVDGGAVGVVTEVCDRGVGVDASGSFVWASVVRLLCPAARVRKWDGGYSLRPEDWVEAVGAWYEVTRAGPVDGFVETGEVLACISDITRVALVGEREPERAERIAVGDLVRAGQRVGVVNAVVDGWVRFGPGQNGGLFPDAETNLIAKSSNVRPYPCDVQSGDWVFADGLWYESHDCGDRVWVVVVARHGGLARVHRSKIVSAAKPEYVVR